MEFGLALALALAGTYPTCWHIDGDLAVSIGST